MSLKGNVTGHTLTGSINKCDLLTISAYGVAVKNGFEGTEEEWLDSLNGGLITVDKQLYRSGHAADAAVVGDKFKQVSSDISSTKEELDEKIALHEVRIDNLATLPEGSTTGDAELIDARLGADGKTYTNLGAAIRTQVGNLKSDLSAYKNFGSFEGFSFTNGWINANGTLTEGTTDWWVTRYIYCNPNSSITYLGVNYREGICGLAFYDKDFKFISGDINTGTQGTPSTVIAPSETRYMRMTTTDTVGKDISYIKFNASGEQHPITKLAMEVQKNTEHISKQKTVSNQLVYQNPKKYAFPIGFSYVDNNIFKDHIFTDGKGNFWTDYSIIDHVPTEGMHGYISPNGSDSNDGLSASAPKLTLQSLLANTNIRIVHVMEGVYGEQYVNLSNRTVYIVGEGQDKTVITGAKTLSWSATSGRTNVYEATINATLSVYDMRAEETQGHYPKYAKMTSIAEVEANAGSWYNDGTKVYVRMSDNAVPTNGTLAVIKGNSALVCVLENSHLYMSNILFYGGGTNNINNVDIKDNTTTKSDVYIYNCASNDTGKATATEGGNGFSFVGVYSFCEKCSAYNCGKDGFGYGDSLSVELNCTSGDNGTEGAVNANGSSAHTGTKLLRINCQYFNCLGNTIQDVGNGTESLNLGCVCYNAETGFGDYVCNMGTAKMWLDSCLSYSSDNSIVCGENGNTYSAKIYKRKFIGDKEDVVYAPSTVETY